MHKTNRATFKKRSVYAMTSYDETSMGDCIFPVPHVANFFSHISPQLAGPEVPAYVQRQLPSSTSFVVRGSTAATSSAMLKKLRRAIAVGHMLPWLVD